MKYIIKSWRWKHVAMKEKINSKYMLFSIFSPFRWSSAEMSYFEYDDW